MEADKKELFTSIKTIRKSDRAYQQLVAIINNCQIMPGEKLPSERELALKLGISRQSTREAIYRAQSMGLIEVRPGEGSFVVSSARETLKDPMKALLEEEAGKIFDFLEIRRVIEGWCAARAAIMATEADLEKIRTALEQMQQMALTDTRWDKEDTDFHMFIAAASKNVLATHIMQTLKESFEEYFRLRRTTIREDKTKKGIYLQQHIDIYEAISRKDSDLSQMKVLEHLETIEEVIIDDLRKQRQD
ncbi:MAG: FadR family transcriptional regulator [Deltaproteobacteria bacterium]|nr:FadR family transcriptional regulator [Deltaproteobacteria bacterium]